jgi:hypothetical protein
MLLPVTFTEHQIEQAALHEISHTGQPVFLTLVAGESPCRQLISL